MKTILQRRRIYIFFLFLLCLLTHQANSSTIQKADKDSSAGLTFEPIQENSATANQINSRPVKNDKSLDNSSKKLTKPVKSLNLWTIFIAGFLGGFAAILLPCISLCCLLLSVFSQKDIITGIFFMAAALALVSFSCTGPIIGTLLVHAATSGARLGPAVGMLGFSLALALPFVLFALFPSWLCSLPKSGGWLIASKLVKASWNLLLH